MTAVAVVVSGWPRISETFAVNEVTALAQRGLLAGVFATKAGDATLVQPDAERLASVVTVLDGGTAAEQAAQMADHLAAAGRPVGAVHGYFAHQPAAVAEQVAGALGVPFSFSVHALDARKVDPAELARRCRAAAVVTTCNADTTDAIRQVGGRPVELPHGVDLTRFRPTPPPDRRPIELLAVGRLVEKKGFVHLIEAMAGLDVDARLRIVGDGPLGPELRALIDRLGLAGTVDLVGRRTHHELPALYASADAVVVPSVIDRHGDRDGLPNVVLEAMASGRPVVATRVAAIPGAVRADGDDDADTGVLVAPGDPVALRTALRGLCLDRWRRRQLGTNARRRAEDRFDLARCSSAWVDLLVGTHQLQEAAR